MNYFYTVQDYQIKNCFFHIMSTIVERTRANFKVMDTNMFILVLYFCYIYQ